MSDAMKQPNGRPVRKTERADPSKPFTVRGKFGPTPTIPGMDGSGPRTFANAVPIKAVYDAATEQLRLDTAVSLIVGHVRMLAQVLALQPGTLSQIVTTAAAVLACEEIRAASAPVADAAPVG